MTDLSTADAARLHRIRHEYVPCGSGAHELDIHFLLRLLDAKPAGEFVTRVMYNAAVQQIADHRIEILALRKRAEAAKAERENWRQGRNLWMDEAKNAWAKNQSVTAERDRLAAALATAQARIEEARAHLGAADGQSLPSDDKIILGHVRDAFNALSPATGPGTAPATEKGTGSPASDTGNRGGGASPAAAPDYEAVCGSCGRPTP